MTTTKAEPAKSTNGKPENEAQTFAEAIAYEETIRMEAENVWGEAKELTPELLRKLRPLLCRPIPPAFIQHIGAVKGKPYESTGIKSVQVQMTRLDNVLGPDCWGYSRTFEENGKLCEVVAWIGSDLDHALVKRDSYGGVDHANARGNLFKSSFTNAAKPALARLGPGWEVYVGATDLDPDVSEEAAEAQAGGGKTPSPDLSSTLVTEEQAANLAKAVEDAGLGGEHVGMKLRSFGVDAIDKLTVEQGMALWQWSKGGGEDG